VFRRITDFDFVPFGDAVASWVAAMEKYFSTDIFKWSRRRSVYQAYDKKFIIML
jgi:hypothetical protein